MGHSQAAKIAKDFVREVETDHYTLRGKDHYNDYPAFVRELRKWQLQLAAFAARVSARNMGKDRNPKH